MRYAVRVRLDIHVRPLGSGPARSYLLRTPLILVSLLACGGRTSSATDPASDAGRVLVSDERRCDRLDDDADGRVDEGFRDGLGRYLHPEQEETAEFYERVLGLTVSSRVKTRHVFFRCGRGMFLLFDPSTTSRADGEVPSHGCTGPGHVAFAIRAEEVDGWRSRLGSRSVIVEREVVWPGGGHSLYFRDPAGNSVELTSPTIWSIREDGAGPES
jgi:catechol 2,3-dioxygenase-like lactoylglutathione lyase family enzyme